MTVVHHHSTQLLIEMGLTNFPSGLASNLDCSNLCLPNRGDYSHDPLCLAELNENMNNRRK
jgi:hypothetical protein